MAISEVTGMARAIFEIVDGIYEKNRLLRQLKSDTGAMQRLLYFECRRNVNLINCINPDKARGKGAGDVDIREIALLLETAVLESVFTIGKLNGRFFNTLHENDELTLKDKHDGDTLEKFTTALEALSYLHVKVPELKLLSKAAFAGKTHRNIQYRLRLDNINKAEMWVLDKLRALPEIEKIAGKSIKEADAPA